MEKILGKKRHKRDIELELLELGNLSIESSHKEEKTRPAILTKEFKPINVQKFKNYKKASPLYFKKLRRNVSQKFKPEEETDAIPLYKKDQKHFNEEEQRVTEYDNSDEERKSPINDIRKRRGDSPLMYSLNQRDKLIRERNKETGRMTPFGGKKKKTLRKKPRKQSKVLTKRVGRTNNNKRYITKK